MRQTAYRDIRRFGYLKEKKTDPSYINETGFISEDEDEEEKMIKTEQEKTMDHLAWLKDFNNKMLLNTIKLYDKYNSLYIEKVGLTINLKDQIVRQKSKEDPTARGSRKYKNALRAILSEEY